MPELINTWSATGTEVNKMAQAAGGDKGHITENGTRPGDQNGAELCVVDWYQHAAKWAKIYRFKDDGIAEKVAQSAIDACTNGWIGYDTWNRDSMLSALNAAGSIRAINTACDTDCSSLMYLVIKEATGVSCEVDLPWLFDQLAASSSLGRRFTSYDEINTFLKTATSAQITKIMNALKAQPTPSPYTDPAFPPIYLGYYNDSEGNQHFNSIQIQPKVRQSDYYLERVLPLAGYKVEVWTVMNKETGSSEYRDGTKYDANNISDPSKTCYLYWSPFDDKTRYVASGQESTLNTNLIIHADNQYMTYLTSGALLEAGDVMRTRAPGDSGHNAFWV